MDAIRRFSKPTLRRPAAVVAFEGWNDACDAASGAVAYLLGLAETPDPFAVIEPEEFFDFQQHRPIVDLDETGLRRLTWPTLRFYAAAQPGVVRDLVLVVGEEPSFRWKTFSRSIARLFVELDVETVLLLGAFIGQVPHTRAVPVVGGSSDPSLTAKWGLTSSRYEGPTGIVSVLQEACREVGLPTISLWAATPHYLAANPNPKAMLALVERAGLVLDIAFDTAELRTIATEFEERVQRAVDASDEFADYVTELEERDEPSNTIDTASTNELVSEIEEFLRKRS